jgi:hypothetical protein
MFTYFTDRDGKYQLGTLKESAFDPLLRTCEFMLKEEAHHMFVGTTGIDRVVERTAQLMVAHDTDEVAARGGIPLDVIHKYLNFHYSVSLDLFGGETSTNVANYYTAGLKGRWLEDRRRDDHKLSSESIMVDALSDDGEIGQTEVAALVGLNTDLRREYIADCQSGVKRWNRILSSAGLQARLKLPHVAFNRRVGAFAGIEAAPDGERITADEWDRRQGEWLPTDVDKAHVRSLMQPVHERGKIAAWIAPPRNGINGKPFTTTCTWADSLGRARGGRLMLDGRPLVDAHVHAARLGTLRPAWKDWAHDFGGASVLEQIYDPGGMVDPARASWAHGAGRYPAAASARTGLSSSDTAPAMSGSDPAGTGCPARGTGRSRRGSWRPPVARPRPDRRRQAPPPAVPRPAPRP